jgi:hypothetical protein
MPVFLKVFSEDILFRMLLNRIDMIHSQRKKRFTVGVYKARTVTDRTQIERSIAVGKSRIGYSGKYHYNYPAVF